MANLGELTATLRANVREWTMPLKQAQAEMRGVQQATQTATNAVVDYQTHINRGLASQYASVRALSREQQAALHAANAKEVLGVRARTAMTQIVGMTAAVSGATGPLGRMAQLLLSLGPGSLGSLGAVVGLTAVVGIIATLTDKARESAKALDEARKAMRELGRTAEEVEAEQVARQHRRVDQLRRRIQNLQDPSKFVQGNLITELLLRRAKNELSGIEADLAVGKAARDALKAGTPTDRADLALEFSKVSKDTAQSLALLKESERELTQESGRANLPIKEQVQLLGALRRVQAQIAELTPKVFGFEMPTSWEEDLRRLNRLGSEWMETLRAAARERAKMAPEMEAPDVDVAPHAKDLAAILKPIEENRRRAQELANRIGEDLSRGIAYGILQKQQSIADALVSGFRFALADLLAKIIKEKLLDGLIKLLAGVFSGGLGGGGIGPIPIPDIPFLPLQASPAGAAVRAGARSSGGMVLQVNVPAAVSPDPFTLSRDAQWLRSIAETNRQLEATGFRFRAA